MRICVQHGDPKDPALRRGQPIRIDATDAYELGGAAKGGVANWFGLSADAKNVAEISMSFPDVRVVDMEYGELVRRIQKSEGVVSAAKHGWASIVVVRSYEGTPTVTIARKAAASAEAWSKLKSDVEAKVQAGASTGDKVTYAGHEPIVFAFETAQINLDLKDLAEGKATVHLASLPTAIYVARQSETMAFDVGSDRYGVWSGNIAFDPKTGKIVYLPNQSGDVYPSPSDVWSGNIVFDANSMKLVYDPKQSGDIFSLPSIIFGKK
jgi:hypothetical protein